MNAEKRRLMFRHGSAALSESPGYGVIYQREEQQPDPTIEVWGFFGYLPEIKDGESIEDVLARDLPKDGGVYGYTKVGTTLYRYYPIPERYTPTAADLPPTNYNGKMCADFFMGYMYASMYRTPANSISFFERARRFEILQAPSKRHRIDRLRGRTPCRKSKSG